MKTPRIILDADVLSSAFKSSKGLSYKILSLVSQEKFIHLTSVPVHYVYEDIILRELKKINLAGDTVHKILNSLYLKSKSVQLNQLWLPVMKNPRDDLILETAVLGNCDFIITYHPKEYSLAKGNYPLAITPEECLKKRV